ncbi:MAG TPA: permease [bacterium]|nr:permease [bacterium]
MDWKKEWKPLAWILGFFLACYYLPIGLPRFDKALLESLHLVKWYAREHVLLCLVPAFYIAGAIAVFVSQDSVMKYLGPRANKVLAYGVASVSGTILAVCSCTVLPLFAGIYRMGAGLGPAAAFLYSGPAINVLAIILTARVLGLELGIARAVGAIVFSVVIGLLMHLIFRKEEWEKANHQAFASEPEVNRPLWQNAVFFASLVGILVFANWGRTEDATGLWYDIYAAKWIITGLFGLLLALLLIRWLAVPAWKVILAAVFTAVLAFLFPGLPLFPFVAAVLALSLITSTDPGEAGEWFSASWGFAKQILPLLLIGVLVSGALLGRPGEEGLIPSMWISNSVGGNSITANFVASFVGAFMYFATLTEVPILQGLIGSGMGKGPALALLLAGPALSLPSMLVINGILGTKKTVVFVTLVILMATSSGLLYGTFF